MTELLSDPSLKTMRRMKDSPYSHKIEKSSEKLIEKLKQLNENYQKILNE